MYIRKTVQVNKDGKKRIYLQLVKSYREGNKVRQKTLRTLGRLDKLTEEKGERAPHRELVKYPYGREKQGIYQYGEPIH